MENNLMKVYVIMSLGRQYLGDYAFLRAEKAVDTPEKADSFLRELKKQYVNPDGTHKLMTIVTETGQADCYCEAGVFEMEVE
jgi:hypothetical protein